MPISTPSQLPLNPYAKASADGKEKENLPFYSPRRELVE
jgi:hypothetical protein